MSASIVPAAISSSSIVTISARTRPFRPPGANPVDSVCGAGVPGYMYVLSKKTSFVPWTLHASMTFLIITGNFSSHSAESIGSPTVR